MLSTSMLAVPLLQPPAERNIHEDDKKAEAMEVKIRKEAEAVERKRLKEA